MTLSAAVSLQAAETGPEGNAGGMLFSLLEETGITDQLSGLLGSEPLEITGIEYEGEIRTADELDEIGVNNTLAFYPEETEALSE